MDRPPVRAPTRQILMVAGHFAVALAAAGRKRTLPMGLLIIAAYSGDLVEGLVAAVNVPDATRVWSHSIPATAIAGIILGIGRRLSGGTWSEMAVLTLVSISHSALDFFTGYKTIWPGFEPTGLRLYAYPIAESVFELIAIVGGWFIWRSAVPVQRRRSAYVWSMLALLVASQAAVVAGVLLFDVRTEPAAMSKFVR